MDFEENSPQNPENDIIVGQICYDELDLKPIEEPKEEQNVAIEGQMGLFDMDNNQTPKIDKKSKETVVKESKKTETNHETTYSNGNGDTPHKGLIYKSLEEVFHDAMIPYTEHVVMDRALPRVEDG